jgi:hypothetical protein
MVSAGLRRLGSEAQTAGAVIRDDLVKSAAELDDKWQKVMATFSATARSATINVIGAIKKFFADYEQEILQFAQMLDEFMRSIPGVNVLAGRGLEDIINSRSRLARDAGIDDIHRPSTLAESSNSERPTITSLRRGGGESRDPSSVRRRKSTSALSC